MNFPDIPDSAYDISFNKLLKFDKISPILYNKLAVYAKLSTIKDLYEEYNSVDDFISRVETAGKRVGAELSEFLLSLTHNIPNIEESENTSSGFLTAPNPFPEFAESVLEITFKSLHQKKLLSNTLYNKLVRDAELSCVSELTKKYQSVDEFISSITGAGARTKVELQKLMEDLESDPSEHVQAYKATQGVYLPHKMDSLQSIAYNLELLLTDSIYELKNSNNRNRKVQGFISENIYIKARTLDETGILLNLTGERVRQIKNYLDEEFQAWFTLGANTSLPNFYVNSLLRELVNKLTCELKMTFPILVEQEVLYLWMNTQNTVFTKQDKIAWRFFCRLSNIRQPGKAESRFTQAQFYIIDPEFDKNSFFTLSKLTLDILKDSVIPMERDEIIIAAHKLVKQEKTLQQKQLKRVLTGMVDLSLEKIPEIESLHINDLILYEVKFQYLTSQADMAERVLYEAKRAMYIDEIIQEMQNRLSRNGIFRQFDETSLRGHMLSHKEHIKPYGKLSLYSWNRPSINSTSSKTFAKTELVKKAIMEANKPLNISDIDTYINNYLSEIGISANNDKKTTGAILTHLMKQKNGVSRLVSGTYILKIWEVNYEQFLEKESYRAVKGSLLSKIQAILDKEPNKIISRKMLLNTLAGHPKTSIRSVLNRTDLFEQVRQDDENFVRLISDPVTAPKVLKKQQILDRVVLLLSSVKDRRLELKVIVKQIEKEFSLTKKQRPAVYKVIDSNPKIFFK